MNICYFGHYEPDYIRNRIIINGLQEQGHTVLSCHHPLRHHTLPRRCGKLSIFCSRLLHLGILMLIYTKLNAQLLILLMRKKIDIVITGHPYYYDVIVAFPLCFLFGKPLVFDSFVSNYENAVLDRKAVTAQSIDGRLTHFIDHLSYRLSSLCLMDTAAHKTYLSQIFSIPEKKLAVLHVGEDNRRFSPQPSPPPSPFRVLFCGSYVPLHGIETIVQAAQHLRDLQDLKIILIGQGQTFPAIQNQVKSLHLTNIQFIDTVPNTDLAKHYAQAHICLGIFGTTEKAQQVIPIKVFSAMAMGKPIITMTSPAIIELLENQKSARLVPPGSPHDLAQVIRELYHDPKQRETIGQNAYQTYQQHGTPKHIASQLEPLLKALLHL